MWNLQEQPEEQGQPDRHLLMRQVVWGQLRGVGNDTVDLEKDEAEDKEGQFLGMLSEMSYIEGTADTSSSSEPQC